MEKQSPVDAQEESVLAKKGQEALDKLYSSALNGIPMVSGSVDDLVEDYLSKYETVEEAAAALVRAQVVKCGTSGFITGFGGPYHPSCDDPCEPEQCFLRADAHDCSDRCDGWLRCQVGSGQDSCVCLLDGHVHR